MSQIQDFEARIDIFLSNLLHPPTQKKYGYKIIHDSIWGTNKFFPWEVGVIDSPLLQRLRRIHQTGLANLVYPTANHTRFDHSLGVTILADKLANHLNDNVGNIVVNKRQKYELRLAAILHDVGHSFFSHVS
ncbi:MAG: HD domain-containing protein, partial [Bacteroidetes bacterium]|nr:HD domain-containing protein [Bacteroidota bacterium]